MDSNIVIRDEIDTDINAITEVTIAAFKTLEISNHSEQFIIEALRRTNALTVSLVADIDSRVIGHIAFSPVTISNGTKNWYGLGPVSVLPQYQRQGMGKALTNEGLCRLKSLDAAGCFVVGHPDYYKIFGFRLAWKRLKRCQFSYKKEEVIAVKAFVSDKRAKCMYCGASISGRSLSKIDHSVSKEGDVIISGVQYDADRLWDLREQIRSKIEDAIQTNKGNVIINKESTIVHESSANKPEVPVKALLEADSPS